MSGLKILSPRGTLEGSALLAEIEFRTSQLRRSGGRRSFVDVVGRIEEESVVRILAAARLGARVVLLHPRWTEEETSRNLAQIQRTPAQKARGPEGEFIVFTSGTEGQPKAVELSAAGFEAHAKATAKRLPSSKDDRWLLALTPAHVGGLAMVLRAHFQKGTLVVPPQPVPHNLTPIVEKNRVSHVSLVPTQLAAWIRESPRPPKTLKVVLVGGAPCPPELEQAARAQGWPLRTTYGLTEASSQVATQTADSPPGSVGPALPGVEVRIDAPDGASGPILVRGPAVMLRYLGDEAATKAALVDGWLRTPDVGRLDAQGNLWVLGRRDDMIVSGGENIDPREIEQVLERHPQIAEACAVGVPDATWGQRIVAILVPRGPPPSTESVVEFARESLAGFKLPKSLEFWDTLPRTAGGKLQRSKARERLGSATVPR